MCADTSGVNRTERVGKLIHYRVERRVKLVALNSVGGWLNTMMNSMREWVLTLNFFPNPSHENDADARIVRHQRLALRLHLVLLIGE
jgi:hypothetical protein